MGVYYPQSGIGSGLEEDVGEGYYYFGVELFFVIGKIWIACARWPACVRRRSIKNGKTCSMTEFNFGSSEA